MTTMFWILQGLLALAFLGAGAMKLMKSRPELQEMGMGYVEDFSDSQIKTIGGLEVLGGIGVILPAAIGFMPMLSGVAAACLMLTMIGAAVTHIKRGEIPMIVPNIVLGAMAGYVAVSYLM